MISKTLVAVLSAAAALSLATAFRADAQPAQPNHKSLIVRYGDLDLRNDAGAQKMLARIAFAADRVCGQTGDNIDLNQRIRHRACVRLTVENTLVNLDSPRVSQLYGAPPRMTLAQYNGN